MLIGAIGVYYFSIFLFLFSSLCNASIGDQILKEYQSKFYTLPITRQEHFSMRMYALTGNEEYLNPIINYIYILSNRYKYCGQKCKGLSHCGENNVNWKKKLTPKQKQFLTEVGLKGLIKQQTSKDPTSIEVKLYRELKNLGLLFETQKLINGKFIVDAYIPSLNLVIEADGDYWHSLDKVMKKDKAENAYLTKCGFKLLRFAEHEINDGSFKERLVN